MNLAVLEMVRGLVGGKAVFGQHVVCASGQGSPAITDIGESEQKLQARFSSVGKIERCWEKIALTGPTTSSSDETDRFIYTAKL